MTEEVFELTTTEETTLHEESTVETKETTDQVAIISSLLYLIFRGKSR